MNDQRQHNTLKHDPKRYAVVVTCIGKLYVKTVKGAPVLSASLADAKLFLPERKGDAIRISARLSSQGYISGWNFVQILDY
jgi:hypothetical protein